MQEAAAKYEQNTQGKANLWLQRTQAAGAQAYCEGLAKIGIPAGACMSGPGSHYTSGVQRAGAAGYQQGVSGKGAKWARDFAAAFSGA